MNSRIGWVFRSLRLNEELASSMGINVAAYRVLAFALSSGIGGVGGELLRGVSAEHLSGELHGHRFDQLHALLLPRRPRLRPRTAGRRLHAGARASSCCTRCRHYQTLIYAGIMILAMLLLPNGIISFPIFHSARPLAAEAPGEPAAGRRPHAPLRRPGGEQQHRLRGGSRRNRLGHRPNGAGKSTLFKLIAAFCRRPRDASCSTGATSRGCIRIARRTSGSCAPSRKPPSSDR